MKRSSSKRTAGAARPAKDRAREPAPDAGAPAGRRHPAAGGRTRERLGKHGAPPGTRAPRFWDELTWFALICLGGWILALAVLPPAIVRLRQGLAFEAECRKRVEHLSVRHAALGQVVNAFETDAHYREEVIRKILGVKKRDEVFLEQPEFSVRFARKPIRTETDSKRYGEEEIR